MWSRTAIPHGVATLSTADLPQFVGGAELALVYLRVPFLPSFNAQLLSSLPATIRETTSAAQAEFHELLTLAPDYAMFLGDALSRLGVANRRVVLPGYYLFQIGTLRGWHIGGPNRADLPRYAAAGVLGWLSGRATGMQRLPWLAIQFVNECTAAARIAERFANAVQPNGASGGFSWQEWMRGRRNSQADGFSDDAVAQAYATLGVTPEMTDTEVRRAFRRRCRDSHPDFCAGDPIEHARRTRELQRINAAYELIQRVRGAAGA